MIELVIISVLFAMFVIGAIILRIVGFMSDWHLPGFMLTLVGGIGLLACSLIFPIQRMEGYAQLDALEAARTSYQNMREDGRDFESFSIYEDITETNRWLARVKRYRAIGFTFIYPEEVESVEAIR